MEAIRERAFWESKIVKVIKNLGLLILLLFSFLLSIDLMGQAFQLMGGAIVGQIISATSNPFISLFIGLLITAIIQSSSTTTAMVVAIVGSGALPLGSAIPMIMGANIGTTITSLIASLGHITDRIEFRKAVSTAISHSLFNILIVVILFPLHFYTGFLSYAALQFTKFTGHLGIGNSWFGTDVFSKLVDPTIGVFTTILNGNGFALLILALASLFLSIRGLTFFSRTVLLADLQHRVETLFFGKSYRALGWGTVLTGTLQSSSVMVSFLLPFVATGKVTIRQVFPFILGANLGTTVTALLAAIAKSEAALSIAMVHVLINLIGVAIVYPILPVRKMLVWLSKKFGLLMVRQRLIGFAYMILVFFIIPFLLIYFNQNSQGKTVEQNEGQAKKSTVVLVEDRSN